MAVMIASAMAAGGCGGAQDSSSGRDPTPPAAPAASNSPAIVESVPVTTDTQVQPAPPDGGPLVPASGDVPDDIQVVTAEPLSPEEYDQALDARPPPSPVDFAGNSDLAGYERPQSIALVVERTGTRFVDLEAADSNPEVYYSSAGDPRFGTLIAAYQTTNVGSAELPALRVAQWAPSPTTDKIVRQSALPEWCVGDCTKNAELTLAGGQPALLMWEEKRAVVSITWVQRDSGNSLTSLMIVVEAPPDTPVEALRAVADEISKKG